MDLRYPQFIATAAHPDQRGSHKKFFGAGPEEIVVPNYSIAEVFMTTNNLNTVRGLHFQQPGQPKVVQVITGRVVGNILCCNPELPEFGTAIHYELSDAEKTKIYVPGDWALGYRALEQDTRVLYLAGSDFYGPGDVGIDPFDPALKLDWGTITPADSATQRSFGKLDAILSVRDLELPPFAQFAATVNGVKND